MFVANVKNPPVNYSYLSDERFLLN